MVGSDRERKTPYIITKPSGFQCKGHFGSGSVSIRAAIGKQVAEGGGRAINSPQSHPQIQEKKGRLLSEREEMPMTLQVCFVEIDGI